jgi:energy-coupling factor transport system ATP-binding protein
MEPEIMVLDEPTSELDPKGRIEIYKLLAEIRRKENITILISGHDSEEMLNFVDRIIVLDNGKIGWEGKPEELLKDVILTEKFGIKPIETAEISMALYQKNIFDKENIFLSSDELIEHVKLYFRTHDKKKIGQKSESFPKQKKTVIEVNALSYGYRSGETVLNNINLRFYKGEFVALIGKNGAGKTTFSKHINGLLRPTSGQILINGRDIKTVSTSELSREVGYVFQNPDHQIFSSSVREEIEYGLKNMNLTRKEINNRISKVLEFVGLKNFENRHPFNLGKGERQKLAVASILAMEPSILVIDEPTTGQDWDGTKRMMTMMEEIHKKGHTIIAITHNLRLAVEYTDRIIVFSSGKVVLDGTPQEVFAHREILESASVTLPDSVLLGEALNKIGFDGSPLTVENIKNELIKKLSDVNAN